MTIAQAENFYQQDKKEYDVKNNKMLANWLKDLVMSGYHSLVDIDDLEDLIDSIVNWYEIKYPERKLEYLEGIEHVDFKNVDDISSVMDMKQLQYRLPYNLLSFIKCEYRAKGRGDIPIYDGDVVVGFKPQIFMNIAIIKEYGDFYYFNRIFDEFLIHANPITGEVYSDYSLSSYVSNDKKVTLDELLAIFNQKYKDKLLFKELEISVFNHRCDIELRDKILQLTALKLLYSKNTTPERGYERAKRFINEFNRDLNLNLSTKEIDEIMHRDYVDRGKKDNFSGLIKSIFKQNGNCK